MSQESVIRSSWSGFPERFTAENSYWPIFMCFSCLSSSMVPMAKFLHKMLMPWSVKAEDTAQAKGESKGWWDTFQQWSSLKPLWLGVRTKSSADKLMVIAAATCQNHINCIRLCSPSTAATHIFVNLCNMYLAYRFRFQADLLQISSNPRQSIKNCGEDQNSCTQISLSSGGLTSMYDHMHTHTNLLIWKHEWSTKCKTLQIQIIVHVCTTPRRWKRSHSWLHRRSLFCCKELPLKGSRPVHRKRNKSKI